MVSAWLYTLLIVAVGLERLVELGLSRRNAAWSFARGGKEYGRGHYPVMVVLHTGFLLACIAEVWFVPRAFVPALGWTMLGLVIGAQALRWTAIATLGRHWNTRVIVVPGARRVDRGIYKYLSHPNYVAVVLEGIALPLVHTAWLTALAFTLLNAALLFVRIRVEERALQHTTHHHEHPLRSPGVRAPSGAHAPRSGRTHLERARPQGARRRPARS